MDLKAEEEQQQQQKIGVCRYVCRLTNVFFSTYDDIYMHREIYGQTTDLYAAISYGGICSLYYWSLTLYFHQLTLTLTRYMVIPVAHPFCELLLSLHSLLLSSAQVQ